MKDRGFWKSVREWDVVEMVETWIDETGWGRIRHRLAGEYRWEAQMARKKNKMERAKGGEW